MSGFYFCALSNHACKTEDIKGSHGRKRRKSNKEMKHIRFNKRVIPAIAVMAAVSGITAGALSGGINKSSAYFTDNEYHTNKYEFGDITVDGTEPDWDPEKTTEMVPLQIEAKNPRLENTGTNSAVGFIVFDSPVIKNVRLSDEEGNLLPAADVEEMKYLDANRNEGFNTAHWKILDSYYVNAAGENVGDARQPGTTTPEGTVARRYVFGYNDSIPGGTAENPTKTDTLFDYIQARNFVEGTFPADEVHDIKVYFLAIQAENLPLSGDVVTTEKNTKNMSDKMLKEIYDIAAKRVDFSNVKEADTSNKLDIYENVLN